MNVIYNLNCVEVINKPCMRESRCMSLLPRTTLHSDSEHVLHTGIHGNMPLLPSYTTYWYIWQYASHLLIFFILAYTTICLTLAHIHHTGIYDSMSHAHILRTLASIFCSLLFCPFSLHFYKGHK